MKTQPRQHISNKYNTCTVVTSPVYIGSKDHFNLINVGLSESAPYCGCVFDLRADQGLVCSCADCCVFSFDVQET